jgi:hypothetical protein
MTPRLPTFLSRGYRVEQHDPLAIAIQAVLEKDLRSGARLMRSKYRRRARELCTLDGYCAPAAGAYFHLGGGLRRHLQPHQKTTGPRSHWWILKDDDIVIDLTVRPNERPTYDYRDGTPRGFTNAGYVHVPELSRKIMDLVLESGWQK